MDTMDIVVVGLVLLILGLDLVALLRLHRSKLIVTDSQRKLQALVVLLVPVLGACAILIFHSPGKDYDRGDFPPAPEENRDGISLLP